MKGNWGNIHGFRAEQSAQTLLPGAWASSWRTFSLRACWRLLIVPDMSRESTRPDGTVGSDGPVFARNVSKDCPVSEPLDLLMMGVGRSSRTGNCGLDRNRSAKTTGG